MQSLEPVIKQLETLFSKFNDRFYNGELPKPIITVSPDNTSGAYGWCTSWKAWTDKEGAEIDEGYYEINLCAEYLSRPIELVAETLLHEMVHLYNLQQKVQDTSRSGTYHNKRYKEAAEKHGLNCDKDSKYGWTKTSLNDEAKAFVDSLQNTKFELFRKKVPKIGKGTSKKSNSRKYVCPCCGTIVRATKEVSIICGVCFSPDTDPVYLELDE